MAAAVKTDVTPAILSRDFVAQLYRATLLQVWHDVSRNFSTVAQSARYSFPNRAALYAVQLKLCRNIAVNADWSHKQELFLFMRQSCSVRQRHGISQLRFFSRDNRSFATKSRDKIAGVTSV